MLHLIEEKVNADFKKKIQNMLLKAFTSFAVNEGEALL